MAIISVGSTGYYVNKTMMPSLRKYTFIVKAHVPSTNERGTVYGQFRVYGKDEECFCGVHVINTESNPVIGSSIQFTTMGRTTSFTCKLTGKKGPDQKRWKKKLPECKMHVLCSDINLYFGNHFFVQSTAHMY